MAIPLRVLIVEDNDDDAYLIQRAINAAENPRFETTRCQTLAQGLEALLTSFFDAVLLDLNLPDSRGVKGLQRVTQTAPNTPVVILTGSREETMAAEALRHGAQDFLEKGTADTHYLTRTLLYAIERHRRQRMTEHAKDNRRLYLQEKAILEAMEKEQRRLGRDLHDGLGQNLTGIALMTKFLADKLDKKFLPESKEAEKLLKNINQAIDMTRRISRGLYAVELEHNDLIWALDNLASRTQDASGISCVFSHQGQAFSSGDTVAEHLYRIVQEAINNAIKHGQPRNIWVDLVTKGGKTTLTVRDDGKGIPESMDPKGGMGLQIMKYRARVIGASLEILRGPQGGTTIRLSL